MLTLEQFAALFRDEEDLREKLALMLRNVDSYQGVRVTHGNAERGKDVIFYCNDPLTGYYCNACVVKKDKISGNVASNNGARTVFHQAEQALDTARIADDGTIEYAKFAYIVSPFDMSENAMLSISGALEKHRGRIHFLCGGRLLEMFEKYYPTGLLFDSTFLGNYVVQLRAQLLKADPVRFLMANNDIISGALEKFETRYVKQDFRKTFNEFEISESVQAPTLPGGELTNESLIPILDWISTMSVFLADEQLWDNPTDSENMLLSSSLKSLAELMREEWETAWKGLHGATIPIKGIAGDRRGAPIVPSVIQKYTTATLKVRQAMAQLHRLIGGSNLYARQKRSSRKLGSSEFLSYCQVEDLTKRHPDFIEALGRAQSIVIPRNEVENSMKPVLITAAAGHGKTSFCKWRVLEAVSALESKSSDIVPFYVALHQLASQELSGDPEEVFLHDPALVDFFRSICAKHQRVLMFLDGLDEVTTVSRQRSLMELAQKLYGLHPNLAVVVTARDHVSGHWLRWLSRIELNEFNEMQVETFVGKALGEKSDDYFAFFSQLSQSRTLLPLTKIPLLCTLIIAVFRRNRALPQNRARLYEIVTDLMCGGWDLAKNVRRSLRFGSDLKREVLTRYAGILHLNRRREGSEYSFQTAVRDVAPSSLGSWRDLLSEILEDSLLTSVGENLAFSHLSFQEYLAAKDLGDPSGNRQKNALRAYLRGDDWWAEALSFYLSSSSRPLEMKKWVESETGRTTGHKFQAGRVARLFEGINV